MNAIAVFYTEQVGFVDFSHLLISATAKDFNQRVFVGPQSGHGFAHFTGQEIGRRQAEGDHNPFEIATQFTSQLRLQILRVNGIYITINLFKINVLMISTFP